MSRSTEIGYARPACYNNGQSATKLLSQEELLVGKTIFCTVVVLFPTQAGILWAAAPLKASPTSPTGSLGGSQVGTSTWLLADVVSLGKDSPTNKELVHMIQELIFLHCRPDDSAVFATSETDRWMSGLPTSGLPTGGQFWGGQSWVHQSSGLPTPTIKFLMNCFCLI